MDLLVYLMAYPLLWTVSRLPFRLLYLLSDGVFFIVYHIIGYRRKVVRSNLELVFPDRSPEERLTIEKRFYRHMCDMFLEMIKTMGLTPEQVSERVTFENIELFRKLEDQGRNILMLLPHYASWEWLIALDPLLKGECFGVYKPVGNRYFDRLAREIRSRFGTRLITTRETRERVKEHIREGRLTNYGILTDQSPMRNKTDYWRPFMGIEVPIHVGAEKLAKRHNLAVIYAVISKEGRGRYRARFELLAERPSDHPDYAITDAFLEWAERSIREAPEYYFWTHKRWKHRGRKPETLPSRPTDRAVTTE